MEHQDGICPSCGDENMEIEGSWQPEGNGGYYPVKCYSCNREFRLYYDLIFAGYWSNDNKCAKIKKQ